MIAGCWFGCGRDHPREYGENTSKNCSSAAKSGPSPRIRGESLPVSSALIRVGTIPANTGRMSAIVALADSRRDHPREYGENNDEPLTTGKDTGPSPRIRGEYPIAAATGKAHGTIPANTGRISPAKMRGHGHRDHPREYGENCDCFPWWLTGEGPSPRIRGELSATGTVKVGTGTIPANTGRIHPGLSQGALFPDHPREYGENQIVDTNIPQQSGPSPRIRGE